MTSRNIVQQRCRTCLDTTDVNFHSLDGKLVKDNQKKTLASFLWDTCKLENHSEAAKFLPQKICGNCLRKLKITFSFVMQVEEVNRKMMANLRTVKIIGKESIPEKYVEETNEMDADNHSFCRYSECFIDCNNSLPQLDEDPIATSTTTNKKIKTDRHLKSAQSSYGQRQNEEEECKNECHKEMKTMLQDLILNQMSKFTQPNADIEENTVLQLANQDNYEEIDRFETVKSWFPISTVEQALELEDNIKNHNYGGDFIAYLKWNEYNSVDHLLRSIFKDELINQYNLDGRSGKMSFITFKSILKCVQCVFSAIPEKKFLYLVRKYIILCHGRHKYKKYNLKKKTTFEKVMNHHDTDLENFTYESSECVESPVIENAEEIEIDIESEQLTSESFEVSNSPGNLYNEIKRVHSPLNFEEHARKRTRFSGRGEKLKRHKGRFIAGNDGAESYVKQPKKSGRTSSSHQQQRMESVDKEYKMFEISKMFPIQSQDQLLEIEQNIMDTDCADEIYEYLNRLKGKNGNIDYVLRKIFSDDLIANYNLEGLQGKHCFRDLNLISDCLFKAFSEITNMEFMKEVRRYVTMSHYRTKNKRTKATRKGMST
ncbi:uncharacterized protein LOC105221568 isoform X2 [Zeugodacus cucurbitae]|uniref:uncharacterized protein LOC105221568 isoform X2 n=1 Tax=Zeugodacus cucurbitae TaxID=28588 RepID=UPI0023D96112|nr:uncharacterized protein LOC105221568 isoform X2 [Zeugodacus cucurbitae]